MSQRKQTVQLILGKNEKRILPNFAALLEMMVRTLPFTVCLLFIGDCLRDFTHMNLLCSYILLCIIIIISKWGKLSFREALKELGMKLWSFDTASISHSLPDNVCLFLFFWKHPATQQTESVSNS